jgi:methylamine--corrinoid protein Co-methyltransferase
MSIQGLLDVLDRAHSGPICTVKDWDTKVIPSKVSEKLAEHGLKGTCTPENPINTDDKLADEFWRAGFELAVDVGVICLDTERVIKFTEEELKQAIRNAPSQATLGEGQDRVLMKARKPEDETPALYCAPIGIVASEELWIPLIQGIAQHRVIDMIQGCSLKTVLGRPLRSGTPYETLAGRVQAQMHKEALWKAGRPGMCATSVITSPTVFGQLGGYGVPGGYSTSDLALVLSPAELKTSYASLHKVVHAINCGGPIFAGTSSVIGGYAGPVEGSAIAMVAASLLQIAVHQSGWASCSVIDMRYNGNCGRDAQWAISVAHQGNARNTHLMTQAVLNQVAGPCTDMLLYESAVGMMNLSVTGISFSIGPRSAGGKYADYISPLECKFCAEVLKGSAGMKRSAANELAKAILPKYEENLRNPPKGKSFTECFDVKTLRPTKEWMDIYIRVKNELVDLGVPLE